MTPVGKIVKLLLALTVGALVATGLSGCKEAPPAPPPAEPKVADAKPIEAKPSPETAGLTRTVELKVTENGFEPSPITLKAGVPVLLKVTRTTDVTCAMDLHIDEFDVRKPLPLNEAVEVRFVPTKSGELKYGCAMDKMVSGKFVIE